MLGNYSVAPVTWNDGQKTAAEIDSWRLPHTRVRWGLDLHDDEKARPRAMT